MPNFSTDPVIACYRCDGAMLPEQDVCPACEADQSKAAQTLHQERKRWEDQTEMWKVGVVFAALLMLAFGVVLGRWSSPDPSVAGERTPTVRATWDQVNSAYVEQIEASLNQIQVRSWTPGPDCTFEYEQREGRQSRVRRPESPECGIILELNPPTSQDPLRLWQVLDAEEREAIMGLLGVTYTRALLAGGIPISPARSGHPRLELRYRGLESPLAIRELSGEIRIFSSPYDRMSQLGPPDTSSP